MKESNDWCEVAMPHRGVGITMRRRRLGRCMIRTKELTECKMITNILGLYTSTEREIEISHEHTRLITSRAEHSDVYLRVRGTVYHNGSHFSVTTTYDDKGGLKGDMELEITESYGDLIETLRHLQLTLLHPLYEGVDVYNFLPVYAVHQRNIPSDGFLYAAKSDGIRAWMYSNGVDLCMIKTKSPLWAPREDIRAPMGLYECEVFLETKRVSINCMRFPVQKVSSEMDPSLFHNIILKTWSVSVNDAALLQEVDGHVIEDGCFIGHKMEGDMYCIKVKRVHTIDVRCYEQRFSLEDGPVPPCIQYVITTERDGVIVEVTLDGQVVRHREDRTTADTTEMVLRCMAAEDMIPHHDESTCTYVPVMSGYITDHTCNRAESSYLLQDKTVILVGMSDLRVCDSVIARGLQVHMC